MLTTIENAESLKQACKDAMRHALTLLRLKYYRSHVYQLLELITDAPDNRAEAEHSEMHKMSFCGERIADLSKRVEYFPQEDQLAFAEAKHFFLSVLPGLTRPSRELLNAAVEGVLESFEHAELKYERTHGQDHVGRNREDITLASKTGLQGTLVSKV